MIDLSAPPASTTPANPIRDRIAVRDALRVLLDAIHAIPDTQDVHVEDVTMQRASRISLRLITPHTFSLRYAVAVKSLESFSPKRVDQRAESSQDHVPDILRCTIPYSQDSAEKLKEAAKNLPQMIEACKGLRDNPVAELVKQGPTEAEATSAEPLIEQPATGSLPTPLSNSVPIFDESLAPEAPSNPTDQSQYDFVAAVEGKFSIFRKLSETTLDSHHLKPHISRDAQGIIAIIPCAENELATYGRSYIWPHYLEPFLCHNQFSGPHNAETYRIPYTEKSAKILASAIEELSARLAEKPGTVTTSHAIDPITLPYIERGRD
jgi:hypothetical protein